VNRAPGSDRRGRIHVSYLDDEITEFTQGDCWFSRWLPALATMCR
jgi:hypothetical protein